jgi:hypothetical protein
MTPTSSPIRTGDLPATALLQAYRASGAYADCYVVDVEQRISQAAYVEAFYTTRLFKLERWLLARFLARPSTDAEAAALAAGERESFAAWRVEGRDARQLLLCDFRGRTRSWLMSTPLPDEDPPRTRLWFGSAVVPYLEPRSGRRTLGFGFRALLGFHRLYSRLLLRAAVARLRRREALPPA